MTTSTTDYDGPMASVYRDGRALPSSTVDTWVRIARRHLPKDATTVLDLGAGTGRFSASLAEGLSVSVVAMEPAAGMRAQAMAALSLPQVHLVAGIAQALPFAPSVVDLVWASQVLHHVVDLRKCATEVRRILKPRGRLLVRASLDPADWILARFFPGMPAAGSTLPRLGDYVGVFGGAGLDLLLHEKVDQVVAADGPSLLDRTKLRADSVLARLDDHQFADGIAALTDAVESHQIPSPVTETVDLLVFAPVP